MRINELRDALKRNDTNLQAVSGWTSAGFPAACWDSPTPLLITLRVAARFCETLDFLPRQKKKAGHLRKADTRKFNVPVVYFAGLLRPVLRLNRVLRYFSVQSIAPALHRGSADTPHRPVSYRQGPGHIPRSGLLFSEVSSH